MKFYISQIYKTIDRKSKSLKSVLILFLCLGHFHLFTPGPLKLNNSKILLSKMCVPTPIQSTILLDEMNQIKNMKVVLITKSIAQFLVQ